MGYYSNEQVTFSLKISYAIGPIFYILNMTEIYVWMYASIQFALVVLFAHILYNLVRSNRSI
ncbi:hypothetical protein ACJIZ3_014585 [Penstemon smallii]|uniref:Uncharacterized protein n=1 Tax=Penstemon smallii TaxID=265156 RepID=A0ABD3RK02_9LAMI